MTRLPRYEVRHADGRRLWVYGEKAPEPGLELPDGHRPPATGQLRLDELSGAWVGIVPSRNKRPLTGDRRDREACPLCVGGPEVPFPYEAAVFENRFPALRPDPADVPADPRFAPARGRCEVVLYTADHDAALATLGAPELLRVIAIWRDRSRELWADPAHDYVLTFENRGEAVGATIAHPHGQIYALDHIPPIIATRLASLERYREAHDACWYCAADREPDASERRVWETEGFVTEVPFAPRWPYQARVRARRHGLRRLTDLTAQEQLDLAASLHRLAASYDRLFDGPLPYMMVIHEAPEGADDWHLTFDFLPASRAPGVLKIRGSVETATGFFVNDVLPEAAADQLRALGEQIEALAPADPFTVEPVELGERAVQIAAREEETR